MSPRSTLVAALIALEIAIIAEAVVAIRAGLPGSWSAQRAEAYTGSGPRLMEGGPHQVFDAGVNPALTVDIGYADLTILTGETSQFDVSLSPDTMLMFHSTAPITAHQDGQTLRIAKTGTVGWSAGDDRMVTVVVPPHTRVTVLHAGDIKATGLRADASFNSVGAGDITIEDYDAPSLRVASSHGSITLHQVAATHLDATARHDGVEGTALHVRNGSIQSGDSVSLGFATGTDTTINAATNDGSVHASGFAAGAATRHKGSEDDDNDSSSETVRVGDGHGHLDVHTSDGSIDLAQEG